MPGALPGLLPLLSAEASVYNPHASELPCRFYLKKVRSSVAFAVQEQTE